MLEKKLDEELEKINSFYFEQEKDAVDKKDKILGQLKYVSHQIEASLHAEFKSKKAPDFIQSQSTWQAWKSGAKPFNVQAKSVSSTIATVSDEANINMNQKTTSSSATKAIYDILIPSRSKPRYARKKMKAAVLDYYRNLDILRGYKNLNSTGFTKILKKIDKNTHLNLTDTFLPKLRQCYFYKSRKLDELAKEIEVLYQSVFADGDRHKAMRKLRLPDLKRHPHHMSAFRSGILLGISCAFIFLSILDIIREGTSYTRVAQIYGALGLPLLMAWMVGVNCYGWERSFINYKFIFELNPRSNLSLSQYFECLSYFTGLWSFFCWLSIHSFFERISPLLHPLIVNGVLLLFLFLPFNFFYRGARYWMIGVLFGIIRTPFIPVYFKDFFVADQFQSLSYMFRLVPLQFCLYSIFNWEEYNRDPTNKNCKVLCDPNKLAYLIVICSLPAIWRFLQCCRRYNDTKMWFPHLANGGKYTISLIAALFKSFDAMFQIQGLKITFIVLNLIGSFFSLYWDYIMDWGFFQPNQHHRFLRHTLVYKWNWAYYFAIVSNFVLRFLWILPLMPPFNTITEPFSKEAFDFILALFEVYRRFQWNFFRVEYEHINNCGQLKAMHEIQLPFKADLFYHEMTPDMVLASSSPFPNDDVEDNLLIKKSEQLDIIEFSRSASPHSEPFNDTDHDSLNSTINSVESA